MTRTPVADWQQLSALYEQADALDPEALADWLAELRLQSHPLLGQLEQMLVARSRIRANGFLGTLPRFATAPRARAPEWQAGSRIGPYRLLRKIGSGGMAEVWLAQRDDGAFQRQVAIKLLFRHADSDERDSFAQRFDRERDILASLNHPHIAGLHDAGVTSAGQPWLALEYVEGQTLTAWCDARYLGIEARVRLFRQVLLAVQHAHANLVIHRDLKPGNILVTAQGEVRLLDFGIAKLLEPEGAASVETELTRQAGRPMTPQYAAPEQLMGQPLTTACDVYSLGVVLYELLCGERPYELKIESAAQLEQAILDLDPRPPSRRTLSESTAMARGTTQLLLRKRLGSDLDAIVLRALAKQPAQRYASVDALRADLDRWLGGEAVEARAPSTLYRVGKFVRRHTLSVSLGASAVVALAVVATAAVVMGLQAREDSARAVAARDFMLNIFQRANQEKSRGADITARDLLETGRKDVLTRLAGQPRLQAELLRGIAKIQSDMGEYASADSTFSELVRIHAALRHPREETLALIDQALNALSMNSPALARGLLTRAEGVSAAHRADAEIAAGLAQVEGWLALNGGDPVRARAALGPAHDIAVRALGETHLRSFRLGQALFRAERDGGDIDAASALQDRLRHTAARIPTLGADEFASMDWEHVNLLVGAGRLSQALTLAEEVLPTCTNALGPNAQPCRYLLVRRAQIMLKLGQVDASRRDLAALRAIYEDASPPYLLIEALLVELRLRSLASGDAPSDGLASVFDRVRRFGEGGDGADVQATLRAGALLGLAESCLRRGDPQEAQRWIARAMLLLGGPGERITASRTAATAWMYSGIASIQQGHFEEGIGTLQRSQDFFATTLGPNHSTTQFVALNRGLALASMGRSRDAAGVVREAQPVLRDALGVSAPTYRRVVALLQRLDESGAATGASRGRTMSAGIGSEFFW